jgi:hypothetical protein
MLHLVGPYVTYGEVNLKAIRELVYKRGYAKVDGQRIPITDNQIIEKQLGKFGIICKLFFLAFTTNLIIRYRGPRPRDRHLRTQLQGGYLQPLALQALQPYWWMEA